MTRVALYTDPRVAKMESVATAKRALEKAGIGVEIYDEVEVEPTDRSFKAGTEFAQRGKFDGFVSVGGGSVMDTAKASNLYSTYPDDFLAYVNAPIGAAKPVPGPLKPHIACPTTFGTARSEEHTSELQSLMRISYAVFCLKKKNKYKKNKQLNYDYSMHTTIQHSTSML